jgi:hypothetical protein
MEIILFWKIALLNRNFQKDGPVAIVLLPSKKEESGDKRLGWLVQLPNSGTVGNFRIHSVECFPLWWVCLNKPLPKLQNNLIPMVVSFGYESECLINILLVDASESAITKWSQIRRFNSTFAGSSAEMCRPEVNMLSNQLFADDFTHNYRCLISTYWPPFGPSFFSCRKHSIGTT